MHSEFKAWLRYINLAGRKREGQGKGKRKAKLQSSWAGWLAGSGGQKMRLPLGFRVGHLKGSVVREEQTAVCGKQS